MKAFLLELIEKDIHVNLEDGELSIRFPNTGIEDSILEEIKSRKQDIITYLMGLGINEYSEIPVLTHQDNYEVSSAQKRLWTLSQFEGGSVAYNMVSRRDLYGNYNMATFKKAIELVVERHEILRTVFKENEYGVLRQWVLRQNESEIHIDFLDFRDAKDKEEKLKSFVQQDSFKSFNLEKGPLFRIALIHHSADHYIFHFNMHHIIGDGWSMDVLAADVMAFYKSVESGEETGLQELKIHYKDYAAWQNDQLDKENNNQQAYWLKQLSGTLPVLDLPGQKARPKIKTAVGKSLKTYLPPKASGQLKAFVDEQGGGMFMGLLTVLNVLLYRYTAMEDIVIGTPIAARNHPDLEKQIGFYVNTLVLRSPIDPKESFKEYYAKVRTMVLDAFKHQSYPFDRLVEDLKIHRDMSRSAIFDLILAFQTSADKGQTTELNKQPLDEIVDLGVIPSKFDLEIIFEENGNHVSFTIACNTAIYEAQTIRDLIQHFKQLLSVLVDTPDTAINKVSFLTNEEEKELLEIFNNPKVDPPINKSLVDLFNEQVAKTPGTPAIVFKDKQLSYQELDDLSNRLAQCFKSDYSLSKGDLVGVQLERSEWFIVAILGILKTGAVYVPIDVLTPPERKEFMVNDAGIKLLLTDSKTEMDINTFEGKVFELNADFDFSKYASDQPECSIVPTDLAYVIYTSGSTGTPKGVMIEHKGIVNTIISQIDIFNMKACKRSLQFASFSFDASISEIFITLLSGSTLYLVSDDTRKDPVLLQQYIKEHKIDIATLPPSYLKLMEMENLKNMKVLVTAGEPAVYEKAVSYLSYGGTFCNAYGPTETSICGSVFKMTESSDLASEIIPIGLPIDQAQIYILDDFGNLQPKGIPGEICIGGLGVGRGYLNRPELTSEKFISHPFISDQQLYKTGDQGKCLPDGNIVFLGRKDDQVKVRGYRVELGEIAHLLASKEDINDVEVLMIEKETGAQELIAYLISPNPQNKGELRQFLSGQLPDYMLPDQYIQVEEIPLTISGKVDKKQLMEMSGLAVSSGVEYVAPKNDIEEKLIQLLSEELKIDARKIGINDNFFDLGMNSVSLIQFLGLFNKTFNLDVKPITLFEHTTINEFVEVVFSDQDQNEMDEELNLSETIDEYIDLMSE